MRLSPFSKVLWLCVALFAADTAALAQVIFWTDFGGRIQRANVDGSFRRVVLQRWFTEPLGVCVDTHEGYVYWTDYAPPQIGRAKLDGTDVKILLTWEDGIQRPRGIAVDPVGRFLYWTDEFDYSLHRCRLDELVPELVAVGSFPNAIAIDSLEAKVYWTDFWRGQILRANGDGTEVESLVYQADSYPWGIALDLVDRKLYWTTRGSRKIQRADLDGTNIEELPVSELIGPRAIVVDHEAGKLYWMDGESDITVYSTNLNGSDRQVLNGPTGRIGWLAINADRDELYWTNRNKYEFAVQRIVTVHGNPADRGYG